MQFLCSDCEEVFEAVKRPGRCIVCDGTNIEAIRVTCSGLWAWSTSDILPLAEKRAIKYVHKAQKEEV